MRTIPWDQGAEEAVLGAMLINANVIPVVTDVLTGADFYKESDGKLFHMIVQMWLQDEDSVDTCTVSSKWAEDTDYIHHLADACPAATNAVHYANIVKRASVSRSLITAGNEIAELGYGANMDEHKMIDSAESRLSHLRRDKHNHTHKVKDLGAQLLASIESGEKPKMISTGFASIDQYAKGFYAGNFAIIGARPGIGKTCLGLQIGYRVANEGTVAFFSLEMKAQELMERLVSSVACVSLTKIRERSLQPNELANLHDAYADIRSRDLRIIDDSTLSMLQLSSQVRSMAKKNNLRLVVVDYLQLMSMGGRTENRREEISEMSRKLKSLAMEVNVPILALSQLNRMSTFDGTKVDISQLKESGSLEQDADMVWLLSWPKQEDFNTKSVQLEIAKNRNGPLGTVDLIWLPQYQRYED